MKEINISIESLSKDIFIELQPLPAVPEVEITFPAGGTTGVVEITRESVISALGYIPFDSAEVKEYTAGDNVFIDGNNRIDAIVAKGNWEQNNSVRPDYIEGRTHYLEQYMLMSGLEESRGPGPVDETSILYLPSNTIGSVLQVGRIYSMFLQGEKYELVANGQGQLVYRDFPHGAFSWMYEGDNLLYAHNTLLDRFSGNIYVELNETVYKPLDEKYIPEYIRNQMPLNGGVVSNQYKRLQLTGKNISLGSSIYFVHDLIEDIEFSIMNARNGVVHEFTLLINTTDEVYAASFPSAVIWKDNIPPVYEVETTYKINFTTINGGTRWFANYETYKSN